MGGYGHAADLPALIARITRNRDGGTEAVHLGHLALDLGYQVRLYPFGVRVFDPSWWDLERDPLIEKLARRAAALRARGAPVGDLDTLDAWRHLLERGGQVAFAEPSATLLVRILSRGRPVICGVSATWLYRDPRERPHDDVPDDIDGEPVGHFIVVRGFTGGGLHFHISDPAEALPPMSSTARAETAVHGEYPLPADRLIHAVLLGDTTRDAVLLELWPARERS